MNQRIVSSRFPYLNIRVRVRNRLNPVDHEIEALVDTGFDGDVVLPLSTITAIDPPDGYLEWRLADASEVLAPYYLATAEIVGLQGSFAVVVSALGDEAMIGRSLIARFTVIFDHGQRLIVEP